MPARKKPDDTLDKLTWAATFAVSFFSSSRTKGSDEHDNTAADKARSRADRALRALRAVREVKSIVKP